MLTSQKIAIAAHLHVLLRRKTGRVTDTEWMAANLEYALEIIRFSRAKAKEDSHPDLAEWADKLERAVMEPQPAARVPLAQSAIKLLRDRSAAAAIPDPTPAAAAPVPVFDPAASGSFASSRPATESGFGESSLDPAKPRKPRDENLPRYVGGIR